MEGEGMGLGKGEEKHFCHTTPFWNVTAALAPCPLQAALANIILSI